MLIPSSHTSNSGLPCSLRTDHWSPSSICIIDPLAHICITGYLARVRNAGSLSDVRYIRSLARVLILVP
jgi:hypothetical protein